MNNKLEDINRGIDKGIQFLADHQFHHGEFCTYMGAGEDLKEWCIPDSSNFSTALIGTSLLTLRNNKLVKSILQKSAEFLKYQMLRGGTWGYYSKLHKGFSLCPADADDTSYISFFLKEMGFEIPNNIPLLLANRNRKGLFYTWFTLRFNLSTNITYWKLLLRELKYPLKNLVLWTRNVWSKSDIDAGINANVLFYIGLTDATASIIPFLLNIIKENKEAHCDKWYPNPFMIYLFISRSYHKGIKELEPARRSIVERIVASSQTDGKLGNDPADTALAINTLLNFNCLVPELNAAIAYLINTQGSNGCWQRKALCWVESSKIGFGSEELTTGFCIEALARYQKIITNPKKTDKQLHEIS